MTQPALFEPLTVRGTTFRNRIWVPAMCQYSVTERDGIPTDWHLVHLGSLARGGAALVIAEATAVVPEGRISPHDTGIWNDAQRDAWQRIASFVRSQGAVPGIQLAHAGRKGSIYPDWGDPMSGKGTAPVSAGGWPTVAPSPLAFEGYADTTEMTVEQIDTLVDAWAAAAVRAVAAGVEVLEIHAAHGYLLHEFLSPKSNARSDEYGGALENRARVVLRIVSAVRAAVGCPMTVLGGAGSLAHIQELIRQLGILGAAAGSLFVFKGVYRAVLINYPRRDEKDALIRSTQA